MFLSMFLQTLLAVQVHGTALEADEVMVGLQEVVEKLNSRQGGGSCIFFLDERDVFLHEMKTQV